MYFDILSPSFVARRSLRVVCALFHNLGLLRALHGMPRLSMGHLATDLHSILLHVRLAEG